MCLRLCVPGCACVGDFDVRGEGGATNRNRTCTITRTRNRINVAWAVQAACATGRDQRFHLYLCFRIDVITQSDISSCRLIHRSVRQFLQMNGCLGVEFFPFPCFLSQNAAGQDELLTTQLKTFVISIMIDNVRLITFNLIGCVFFLFTLMQIVRKGR